MSYVVVDMTAADWEQVRSIYLEGIATGHATFETDAPEWEKWDAGHLRKMRLVAREGAGAILGWAALSPVSDRCVYGGVAEVSVYVGEHGRGRGVGRALLEALIEASEQNGIWTLQAGVFPENAASVKLHLSCGFREVGRRERIGKMNGVWRDTLLLERRSQSVGTS
jgi:phosphinothricin acetyltransferase